MPALVALAVLDCVTALAGHYAGRTRLANGKSWEGTLAGCAVTAAALLPFLTLPGAVIAALVAGAAELASPVDDNLVIPVAVCGVLQVFPLLILPSL